jgi:hypothetical protein
MAGATRPQGRATISVHSPESGNPALTHNWVPASAGTNGIEEGARHRPYSLRRRVRRRLDFPSRQGVGGSRPRKKVRGDGAPGGATEVCRLMGGSAPCDRRARHPALHVRRFWAPSAALPGGDGAPHWAPDPERLPPPLHLRRVTASKRGRPVFVPAGGCAGPPGGRACEARPRARHSPKQVAPLRPRPDFRHRISGTSPTELLHLRIASRSAPHEQAIGL